MKLWKANSRMWHKAVERKNRELRHIAYCEFLNYAESRGWKIKNEDWYYIDNLNANGLRHLLDINRGRNDLYIPNYMPSQNYEITLKKPF